MISGGMVWCKIKRKGDCMKVEVKVVAQSKSYDFDLDEHTIIEQLLEEVICQIGLSDSNSTSARNLFLPAERKRLSKKSTLAKEQVRYGDVLLLL